MADFADRASDTSADYLQDALARRERERRMSAPAESAHDCEECGEQIPEARRKAVPGCTRCASCQSNHERPFRR